MGSIGGKQLLQGDYMSFNIKIEGLEATLQNLKKVGINIKGEVNAELSATARDIEVDSSRNAPYNFGNLRGSITAKKEGSLRYAVVAQSKYAAFMEFGTKKKTKVPPGFEGYAATFMGQSEGDFGDLVLAIAKWVKRKGIAGTQITQLKSGKRKGQFRRAGRKAQERAELNLAWAIAMNIAKNGVSPHPFMFPALMKNKPVLVDRLNRIMKKKR